MIDKLEIQNFKCFRGSSPFEFSKLNLLTGINGRGKSSILQSILLISQSATSFQKIEHLNLNGKHVNLGNFDDIKNSETPRSEDIILKFLIANTISASFQFQENESDELTARISNVEISIEDTPEVNKLNTAISNFVENIEAQFGDLNASELPVDAKSIIFNQIISKIHYISADRLGPVKYVDKASFTDPNFVSVGSRGEYTINVLAKSDLPVVDAKLYLGSDANSVMQQTEEWLGYILEGAKIKLEGLDKTSSVLWMLINNKSNSYKYKPTNVGFGYSYILPLIVSGLIAKDGDLLIVENPEAHLHPRAQARISQFLARVASCGVQVIIESHSEHILNGLRVSALNPDIEIKNSEIAIHYFNEAFQSEKLLMDEKGKIANWPTGFFDQQEIDLADIFKLSR